MALREKLEDRVYALTSGERVESVFLAQTGPHPVLAAFTVLRFWAKDYVLAATDRRIAVFRATRLNPAQPKEEVASFPRDALSEGLTGGLWSRIDLAGTRYWVNARFRQDVESAVRRSANPS